MLCGAISSEHWSRLQGYAERMQIMAAEQSTLDEIHPSVWLFLTARLGGSPLLPRVRELHVHRLRISGTPFLAFLLSPTIRLFDLSFGFESEEEDRVRAPHVQTSILQTLPDMVPDLEDFTYGSGFDLSVVRGCLQQFTQFKRLKSLITPPDVELDQHVLQVFSSVSTLQILSCCIDLSGISTLVLPSDPFLQLAEVDLRAHTDHLITFFRACPFPNLVRIELHITDPPTVSHPRDLFVAICKHCDPTLIKHLDVDVLHRFIARPSSLMEYAEPLVALRNMRSFRLCFWSTEPSICDDDILRIGTAWPRLTSLNINHITQQYSQPDVMAPSLSAIVELARRCPALTSLALAELALELDPRGLPKLSAVPPLGHGLRYLDIDCVRSPPSSHEMYLDMATVLDRVFPSIDLDNAMSQLGPHGKSWADILRLMEAMQVGRANGAMFAQTGSQRQG
ncbi:hypothetical protein GSI_05576 [Ganoderma sinense ZZ0214-1]|uniref:Uncharacterized protein n=1 Tax=Ganoderma sinense ZZ0214-1 TaxID=1077348 RepID=A0A2G8SEZ0_9APHY|nr:hypothetical protein GSI_05576 [Ganoderma sinense ZZ0214-1]